ncbi:MAG: RICIN domain-containing protein [Clostridia bacterium]
MQSAGDGYYYIVACNSYLYLDIKDGNASNGINVQIYEGNETNSQKFKFEKTKMIDSDSYNILIKQD